MQQEPGAKSRLELLDLARGTALVAMAIYHFAWDLEFFGYVDPGMTTAGGWRLFARSIASSFLFLVGFSLVLAHGRGVRWRPFLRRLATVAAAAAAISLVTWLAVPGGFIFFGILHQIALASLLGLAFLRLPPLLVLACAVLVIAAPAWLRSPVFDHPLLWWVGLSVDRPRSNDFVPLFPWFGAVLLGIAAARFAQSAQIMPRLEAIRPPRWTSPVQWAGRHSLAFYLVHQPLLIAAVYLFSLVVPPVETPRDIQFTRACTAQCEETREAEFCALYCVCVLDTLEREALFDDVYGGSPSASTSLRLQEIVSGCSFDPVPDTFGEENR